MRSWSWVALLALPVSVALGCSQPKPEIYRWNGETDAAGVLLMAWTGDATDTLEQITLVASSRVPILFVVDPKIGAEAVREHLGDLGVELDRITFVEEPLEAPWVRDFGPLAVTGEGDRKAIVDFDYVGRPNADRLPERLSARLWPDARLIRPGLEIEGGNLLADGAGTCMMAESPWITVGPVALEAFMRHTFGCTQLIWLQPLDGEPTGHADMFAFSPGPGRVVVGRYDAERDPTNAFILDDNAARLERAGLEVTRVPMPDNRDGRFRSYTNILALGDLVLVPVYPGRDPDAQAAVERISSVYPGREIALIDATESIELDGALHCLAQVLPAAFARGLR